MNREAVCQRQGAGQTMQRGQAMTEMLVVVPAIWGVLMAVALLGEWQDQALQADQAGRHGAFMATARPMQHSDFSSDTGPLPARASARFAIEAPQAGRAWQQPGDGLVAAERLRREWSLDQASLVMAEVRARPLRQAWQGHEAVLLRRTAILAGAGHAADDMHAQRRIAESGSAWGDAYGRSRMAGQDWTARLQQVDAAWGRSLPDFDWLTPWAGQVPSVFLSPGSKAGERP